MQFKPFSSATVIFSAMTLSALVSDMLDGNKMNNVLRLSAPVPADSAGKPVTLAGELVKKEMNAEQLAHFNQDVQGGSDALKEGVVYQILAGSVKIPKA
ncbi:MAG: hypothetical protein ACJAYN_002781 [Bermanella sp.]|jgi:hypothetical protein|uniref:hypothetical protein n=1 Tax=Glaciecola sp. 33A TaxID=2057807 RepID=UPI000C34DA0C|nr:hypothetical protein [Glaciecola sp. 33A]PKI00675.1 hypothetical protein CXF81_15605 [Glaciecola sp. 33A]